LISAEYKLRTCRRQKASECLIERVLTAEIGRNSNCFRRAI
jgi:hypothetical protein